MMEDEVLSRLSPRERGLMRLVSMGMTNKEISDELNLSPHTVRNEVIEILRKLKLQNRTQIAFLVVTTSLTFFDEDDWRPAACYLGWPLWL